MKKQVLKTEFDSPEASPGFLLWQINNKWQAQQRKALAVFNLTHVQFVLLASLVWSTNKTPFTQKQLAEHAKTDTMMTSQVLRALEKKQLIVRTTHADDGRAIALQPTEAGIKLINQAIQAVEGVDRWFFEKLGNDKAAFTALMQKLAV